MITRLGKWQALPELTGRLNDFRQIRPTEVEPFLTLNSVVVAITGHGDNDPLLLVGAAGDVVPIIIHYPHVVFMTTDDEADTTYFRRYTEMLLPVSITATAEQLRGSPLFEEIDFGEPVEWPENRAVIAILSSGQMKMCPHVEACLDIFRADADATIWIPIEDTP